MQKSKLTCTYAHVNFDFCMHFLKINFCDISQVLSEPVTITKLMALYYFFRLGEGYYFFRLGEGWSHVAAVTFKVQCAVRLGHTSVTAETHMQME